MKLGTVLIDRKCNPKHIGDTRKQRVGVVGVKGASILEQIFSFVGLRTTKISAFVL